MDFKSNLTPTPMQHGFTLLEVMVVVFLIALTVSIVSVNFNQNIEKTIEAEAKRFVALTELLCQESIIQGKVFAIDSEDGNSYRFLSLKPESNSNKTQAKIKWETIKGDDIFRARILPENMSIEIDVQKAGNINPVPRIVCKADGMLPRFTVYIEAEDKRMRVLNDLSGKGVRFEF